MLLFSIVLKEKNRKTVRAFRKGTGISKEKSDGKEVLNNGNYFHSRQFLYFYRKLTINFISASLHTVVVHDTCSL